MITLATLKKILIIGCGWLGLPLAKKLIADGNEVWATTSSETRLASLSSAGIRPYLVNWQSDNQDTEALIKERFQSLIVTIPPGSRDVSQSLALHKRIAAFCEKLGIPHWVYCSTTSVYPEREGEVKEDHAMTDSNIFQLENAYTTVNENTAVLRFGGLIGLDRHPVKYLASSDRFMRPFAPVNLTTARDAMDALEIVIDRQLIGIFNIVNPEHPTRLDYYSGEAKIRGLVLPDADLHDVKSGKVVSSQLFQSVTGYRFTPLRLQQT